jgi:cysteinyl-tRNA synthetase
VHYRAQLNFTFEGMEESRQALTRIDEWLQRLRETSATASSGKGAGPVPTDDFQSALDDDLNISGALGILFESIRETNARWTANELDADCGKSMAAMVGGNQSGAGARSQGIDGIATRD